MARTSSYRELAEHALVEAGKQINAMPSGRVASDEIQARAAHVQAITAIATVQALLEIGDILRSVIRQTGAVAD